MEKGRADRPVSGSAEPDQTSVDRPTKRASSRRASTANKLKPVERTSGGRSSRRGERQPIQPSASRRRPELDDADRQLIARLAANGRLSNRALAADVGLTEPTVAARLRSLSDHHILGVTASLDWSAAGYRWDAWLQVTVAGRSVREVSADIARIEGVRQVNIVFGPFDIIAHLLLPDESLASDVIADQISQIPGVYSVRPNVTMETVKFETKHARIPIRPVRLSYPKPVVELDDLDRGLIEVLVADGRQSNRKVASKLGVSEGTIRVRLKKMEEAGLLRITARSDPYLTGEVNAWATIGVDAERGAARQVARLLADLPETVIVALVAGSHDILASVAVVSRTRLTNLVLEEIRDLPGVRSTATWEIVHTSALSSQWARLLTP